MITDSPDYTSVGHQPGTARPYVAQIWHWDKVQDSYQVAYCQRFRVKFSAELQAKEWAKDNNLEYRP